MKKLTRTTMTWRFVNPMAPAHQKHMPTKVCEAVLVQVTATMFRGKATLRVEFEAEKIAREVHQQVIRQHFRRALSEVIGDELGTDWDYADDDGGVSPVWANGSALTANLRLNLRNGEGFTHTAMQKFVKLVTLIGQEEWRGRYYLPDPEVVQETMVEAYAEDNWITYGQYLGDMFQPKDPLGPKSDLEA
jgi:hypothetical protein